MDDALGIRADENAAYITARDDDVKAVEVLNSTLDALSEFYENNGLEMDTIPDGAGAPETTLLQKGPATETLASCLRTSLKFTEKKQSHSGTSFSTTTISSCRIIKVMRLLSGLNTLLSSGVLSFRLWAVSFTG